MIGILKKIKDADPADSHHAPEWEERQRSRMKGLWSRLLMWRLSPESMIDDLENITCCLPIRRERLPAGALQRELLCDPGVRRSRA